MTSILKEAREKAGYSVEEVADKLKIRKQYIIDLEEETFDDIPGQVYVEGYTKLYYEFLGLKPPKPKKSVVLKRPVVNRIKGSIDKKHILLLALGLLALTISLYSFIKTKPENDLTEDLTIEEQTENDGSNETEPT